MSNSSFLTTRKIGLIGYGTFGKFFCEQFLKGLNVSIYSPHFSETNTNSNITSKKNLRELVENTDLIIPAVPINKFKNILQEILPFLRTDTIILDVCSVKSYPVQIMQKLLPASIQKIATHPMFGPSSFNMKETISGFPMVMHNAGCDQAIYNHIKQYFADRGLQIIEMQPDEHDALAAKSQFFSQLIKASAQIQKLHPTLIDTPGASALFESFSLMNIPGELLLDMHNYNKYAKKVLEETIRSLNHIKKKSEKK